MQRTAYTVIATFPNRDLAKAYIDWLTSGHVQAVLTGGAASGAVLEISDPADPPQVESRYVFPNRDALDRYVREVAPALRADGLKHFGPERGVHMERRIGQIIEFGTRTTPSRPS